MGGGKEDSWGGWVVQVVDERSAALVEIIVSQFFLGRFYLASSVHPSLPPSLPFCPLYASSPPSSPRFGFVWCVWVCVLCFFLFSTWTFVVLRDACCVPCILYSVFRTCILFFGTWHVVFPCFVFSSLCSAYWFSFSSDEYGIRRLPFALPLLLFFFSILFAVAAVFREQRRAGRGVHGGVGVRPISTRRFQRLPLQLRPDRVRQDAHHAGQWRWAYEGYDSPRHGAGVYVFLHVCLRFVRIDELHQSTV